MSTESPQSTLPLITEMNINVFHEKWNCLEPGFITLNECASLNMNLLIRYHDKKDYLKEIMLQQF